MTDELFDAEVAAWLDAPLTFKRRPDPVAPQFRPTRRIAICLMIVDKSFGRRATWKSLHVMSWAIKSQGRLDMLTNIRNGVEHPDRPIIRFEPALDRALDLAVGVGLLARTSTGAFAITPAGDQALLQVKEAAVLQSEKAALRTISGKVSNKDVERLLEWRRS